MKRHLPQTLSDRAALLVMALVLAPLVGCGDDGRAPDAAAMDAIRIDDASTDLRAVPSTTPTEARVDATDDTLLDSRAGAAELDILFVVDNSPSMQDEQQVLAQSFPALLGELRTARGGLPNLHIGIVSTDLGAVGSPGTSCPRPGDQGALQAKENCGLAAGSRWMTMVDDGRNVNFAGDPSTVFGCLSALGTSGCGYEHQLASAREALSDAQAANRAFLRAQAHLAIIFITDEDDCSAPPDTTLFAEDRPTEASSLRCATEGHVCNGVHPPRGSTFQAPLASCAPAEDGRLIRVQELVAFFKGLKPRPAEQILVASLHGWPLDAAGAQYAIVKPPTSPLLDVQPACETTGLGKAFPAVRMKTFTESFGPNGLTFSLCAADLRTPLRTIGQRLTALLASAR